MHARVRVISEAEDVAGRVLDISLEGLHFSTPVYAVPASYIDGYIVNGEVIRGFVEFTSFYRGSTLRSVMSRRRDFRNYDYRTNTILSKAPSESLVVAIPLVDFRGVEVGSRSLLRLGEGIAVRMLHPRVGFTCLPSVYNADVSTVLEITKGFIDIAVAVGKPIALTININLKPDDWFKLMEQSSRYLEDLGGQLLENILCIDYGGSNPITRFSEHNIILGFSRRISRELGIELLLYGVNVKYGRLRKGYWRRPARDIASFYIGLDIVGPNHRVLPINRNVAGPSTGTRILVRKHYAYVDSTITSRREYIELLASELNLEENAVRTVIQHSDLAKVKSINIRNASIEAGMLQRLFRESEVNVLDYLKGKDAMREDGRALTLIHKARRIIDELESTPGLDSYMH